MSTPMVPEKVCYIFCNFCNTTLAVSVPGISFLNIVTVRCGHCANLLTVNMGSLLQALPLHDLQNHNFGSQNTGLDHGSSSKYSRNSLMYSLKDDHHQQTLPFHPPEKRQRVPSAYNRFIREEIQRIKANKPDISHKEAFSAAAKNWAHFPHIHFGLTLDGNKQVNLEEAISAHSAAAAAEKTPAFY